MSTVHLCNHLSILHHLSPLHPALVHTMARKRQCTSNNYHVSHLNAPAPALTLTLCFCVALFLLLISPSHSTYEHETGDTLAATATSLEMFVDKLPRMPVINGYTRAPDGSFLPAHLTIGMYLKKWKFHRDLPSSDVFAYGRSKEEATVPGPTIKAMVGVKTYVKWENHLPDRHVFAVDPTLGEFNSSLPGVPTVVHVHGAASEPHSDGHALAWFTRALQRKGSGWTKEVYEYENVVEMSGSWYHDHADSYTRLNLLAGLVGVYKVVNPELEYHTWKLPHKRFEVDLVVTDHAFTRKGQIYMNATGNNPQIHPQWQPEYFGDVIVVNGKAWPYLKVQRRKYRFRIINASNARFYRFALDNGMHFIQIGADSFYFEKPIHLKEILMAPSETVDVILDFFTSNSSVVILTNNASYPFPDGDPVNEQSSMIMKFVIQNRISQDRARIPEHLMKVDRLSASNATHKTRNIILSEFETPEEEPTHLLINFRWFTDPVTETPSLGSTEMWRIINLTPDNHPLHVHLVGFQVIHEQKLNDTLDDLLDCVAEHESVEGCDLESFFDGPPQPPAANEAGFKNVYKMKPFHVTSILIRFSLPDGRPFPFNATGAPGYAYHCHILDHEDNAMMRPYQITH